MEGMYTIITGIVCVYNYMNASTDASEHRRCRGAWGESHRHASIWSEYKCNRCHCNVSSVISDILYPFILITLLYN